MTVDTVTITKHEEHPQWYRMVIKSWTNSIGTTSIEMLVTEDTLRRLSREISKFVPQSPETDIFPISKKDK